MGLINFLCFLNIGIVVYGRFPNISELAAVSTNETLQRSTTENLTTVPINPVIAFLTESTNVTLPRDIISDLTSHMTPIFATISTLLENRTIEFLRMRTGEDSKKTTTTTTQTTSVMTTTEHNLLFQTDTTETVPTDRIGQYSYEVWCKLQMNGYPCNNQVRVTKFYYDLKLEDCRPGLYGQCKDNVNSYNSLRDCQYSCRDVGNHRIVENISPKIYCRLQPDFGDCDSYFPSFYFDLTARECRGFSYSGCGGNLNRFQTSQLCNSMCKKYVEY